MKRFEKYNYENKTPIEKCNEMLEILISFYNDFNGKDNSSKEITEPWIYMIRNTKDYHILLCYEDNLLIGFINYMYQEEGLMLSEIQLRKEYQNKGYLKDMLKEIIVDDKTIFGTIHKDNVKSQEVFKHIGFELVDNNLYKISYDNMIKWLNN